MITELTSANFHDFTDGIIDFWATWCGPCRMLSPILDEIAEENGYDIGKVNIDEEPGLAREHRVAAIPTLIFMRDGQEVGRSTGYLPKDALAEKIADALY